MKDLEKGADVIKPINNDEKKKDLLKKKFLNESVLG